MQSSNAVSADTSTPNNGKQLRSLVAADSDKATSFHCDGCKYGGALLIYVFGDRALALQNVSIFTNQFDNNFDRNNVAGFFSLIRRIQHFI